MAKQNSPGQLVLSKKIIVNFKNFQGLRHDLFSVEQK